MQEIIAKLSVFSSEEFLFLGLFVMALLDLIFFLWSFFRERFFVKNSSQASAVVVEVREVVEEKKHYQELTLLFKDYKGVEFAPVVENHMKPRQKGERVNILYANNDPSNARINAKIALYLHTMMSFFVLLGITVIGIFMWKNGVVKVPANFWGWF